MLKGVIATYFCHVVKLLDGHEKKTQRKPAPFRQRLSDVSSPIVLWSDLIELVFEDLLNIADFPLKFAGYFLSFATCLNIVVVRHFSKPFLHATLHFAHFAFRLIDRAIFHKET